MTSFVASYAQVIDQETIVLLIAGTLIVTFLLFHVDGTKMTFSVLIALAGLSFMTGGDL